MKTLHPPAATGDPANGSATPPDGQRFGRRPALPTGRAVVGGLLVTTAAVLAFAAYAASAAPPTHEVAVARATLRPGDRLGVDDIRMVPLDLPEDLAVQTFATRESLAGATVLAPLEANQLVGPASVRLPSAADAPTTTHEFSFALPREKALDGHLQRGETVDLVATYGSGDDAYSTVVVRGGRVVDIDATGRGTVGSSGNVTITLAVDDERRVLEATHALETAKVTLARGASTADPAGDTPAPARYRPATDTTDTTARNGVGR